MKSKKTIKLIPFLIAISIFLQGCKIKINDILDKDKTETPKDDFTTSQIQIEETETTSPTDENLTIYETIEETIKIEEIIPTTIPVTEETTEPTISETKPKEIFDEEEPQDKQNLQIIVKATANVNIRSGNNTNALIIGELKKGETAYKIMSCENNWDIVKVGDIIGYVCRDYLEYTEETYNLGYKYTERTDIVITKTDLNCRTFPTTESKIIKTFKKNTELEVIAEIDNGWLLVENNGILGYVHGNYVVSLLELANLEYRDLNLEKLDVQKIIYTTASSLNIRSGPGTEYEKIGSLETYESARIIKEFDGWYFIMTNEYTFGYISKKYTQDLEKSYVIVDKSEQRLYLYYNNELLLVTPVTTGKDSTPSDTGLFDVYDRTAGRYLTGEDYHVWVDYWIAYNGGEGLQQHLFQED